MLHRKHRPTDGPGANGLRGGKNVYCSKVSTHTRIEDVGGPAYFKRGFTNEDFETENTAYGGTRCRLEFGAALPVKVSIEKPSTFDVFAPVKELDASTWQSTARGTFIAHTEAAGLPSNFTDNKKNERSYETWTKSSEAAAKFRYQVESRLESQNTDVAKFKTQDIRLLPGVPIGVEKFRRRLMERHGMLGLSALRFYLPDDQVSSAQFRKLVSDLGLEVSKVEFSQVLSHFTVSDSFDAKHFLRTVTAIVHNYPSGLADRLLRAMGGSCSIEDFSVRFIRQDLHPEVAEGLRLYLPAYANELGLLDKAEVGALCSDLYASTPYEFVGSWDTLWSV